MTDRSDNAVVQLKIRMRETLRAKLEAAADARGVSLNAEAVERLENTFGSPTGIGGPEEAALASLVMSAFMRGGQMAAQWKWKDGAGAKTWVNDPYCFQQACLALGNVLSMMEPAGQIEAPGMDADDMVARMNRNFSQIMGGIAVNSLFKQLGVNPKRDTREVRRTKALRIGPGGEDLSVQEPKESDNG